MATAKKTAPAKTVAPAAKSAAPAARRVAAPAPAPAPVEEVVEETGAFDVGSSITFLGYGADVAEADQFLTAGEVYEVVGFTEAEGEDPGGDPIVRIDNPGFNAKKKETEDNPKTLDVAVFAEEYEVAAAEEEPVEEVAAQAPAPAAKKAAVKTAPAKTAAPAAKTAAPAAAKKTAKAAPAPVVEEPAEDPDALPDLENEDEEVLALVNGDVDLIEVAQNLEATAARSEYQLGGVLFHIKKAKQYEELDEGIYKVNGGWAEFLKSYFNIEYRKAQYLIQIYIAFTQAQIENPADVVARLGWAKAQKISVPMAEEGAVVGDLIALAEANTVVDLSTALKEQIEVGGTPGAKVSRITMKFRYDEEEGASINAILAAVQEANGLKDIAAALSFVVNDWASHNGVAKAKAAAAPAQTRTVGKPVAKAAPAKKAVAKA